MTREEFKQFIDGNEYKDEILRLVDESIKLLPVQDEISISNRYEECAMLYNDSIGNYPHFRLNISKQIDRLRYQKHCYSYEDAVQAILQNKISEVNAQVETYAQVEAAKHGILFDEGLVDDIKTLLVKYVVARENAQSKLDEINDVQNLLQMRDSFKCGFCINSIKLRGGGAEPDKTFAFHSEKFKNLFSDIFLPYFMDRFVELVTDLVGRRDYLNKMVKRKLVHKLVYDLYMIFIKHGKIRTCQKNDNAYDLKDGGGNYYSLNGNVSEWIYNLMDALDFVFQDSKRNKEKSERCRYIKDCIRDKESRQLELEDFSLCNLSLFL